VDVEREGAGVERARGVGASRGADPGWIDVLSQAKQRAVARQIDDADAHVVGLLAVELDGTARSARLIDDEEQEPCLGSLDRGVERRFFERGPQAAELRELARPLHALGERGGQERQAYHRVAKRAHVLAG